jgi:hypothetical protein
MYTYIQTNMYNTYTNTWKTNIHKHNCLNCFRIVCFRLVFWCVSTFVFADLFPDLCSHLFFQTCCLSCFHTLCFRLVFWFVFRTCFVQTVFLMFVRTSFWIWWAAELSWRQWKTYAIPCVLKGGIASSEVKRSPMIAKYLLSSSDDLNKRGTHVLAFCLWNWMNLKWMLRRCPAGWWTKSCTTLLESHAESERSARWEWDENATPRTRTGPSPVWIFVESTLRTWTPFMSNFWEHPKDMDPLYE